VSTLTNMLGSSEGSGVRTHLQTVPDETSLATFVWATLKERYESSDKDEFEVGLWETRDFHLREIAPRTYLLTYTLWGSGRPADPAVDGVAGKR
jgi:hypothetical protein